MDPGPAYKRRRPAVACTECRRRKVRCDRASPCGPCDKSGFRCVYHNNPTDRMQQDMFAQLAYGPSILKPNLADIGDMDMLPMDMTYLNDDSSLGFIDYFSLNIPPTENESLYSAASQIDGEGLNWTMRTNRAPKGPSSLVSSTPSTSDSIAQGAFGFSSSESGSLLTSGLGSANSMSGLGSNGSSSSPSPASLQSLADINDDSERRWQDAFYRCKRLQFLASVFNSSDDSELTSSDAMVRSLMKRFTKLDRVAQKNWETQAMSPHNTLRWPAIGTLPGSTGRSLLPPRETCDILLDTYINTFESVLRILHVPSFQREYKRFWSNPTSLSMDEDEAFACKLMIILALGSVVCSSRHILDSSARRQGVSLRQQARGWIVHARQWLGSKIFAQADLDNVQTRCLLALARHTHQHTLPAGAVWFPGDQDLTRVGIQMGLHREPRVRSPNMSAKEAEIRRRLWATMLELSLQMCFDEGLPAPISPESYDCEPPSSITDEDLESEDVDAKKKASAERLEFTPSIVQVLLARTQRLRLQILQRINAPGASSKAYEESHKLAAQLNTSCCTALDMLRSTKKATNFQIKLLDVFTRPFVLALHEPFADRAATDPMYYYSRKMRMEVSALLLANPLLAIPAPNTSKPSIDSGLGLSGSTNLPNTYVRPPGIDACAALSTQGHGHFALVQRQATAALCLDLISELEEKSFPATDGAGWEKLRGTIRHAVLGYERRVRAADGTHSTHEFLFFACAEAYIEALLRGYHSRDADEAIAEAARTALAVCCEVMKRQRQGSRAERSGEGEGEPQMWPTSDYEEGYASDGDII